MKARPILFSAPMVRALLAGTKTQTRRGCKPQPETDPVDGSFSWNNSTRGICGARQRFLNDFMLPSCPYGQPGDRLWVRETWQHPNHPFGPLDKTCAIFYRADYSADPHGMDGEKSPEGKYRQWRPSIHMPRWASRITLEITGVRIERLQGISENDAKAEGVEHYKPEHTAGLPACSAHRYAFEDLWRDINGPGSWEANPWVWVVEFKRIRP